MNIVFDWVRNNIINVINGAVSEYWGGSIFVLILFISCLTILILNKNKLTKVYNLLGIYSIMLLAIVLLNPIAIRLHDGFKEAFVLLPMGLVVSCVIAGSSQNQLGKSKATVILVLLAVLISLAGSSIERDNLVYAVNSYKVDDQGLITVQAILEDSNYEAATVCYVLRTDEYHWTDVAMCEVAEQYSGLINAYEAVPGENDLWEEADYIVINNALIEANVIDTNSYETVTNAGSYTVLK